MILRHQMLFSKNACRTTTGFLSSINKKFLSFNFEYHLMADVIVGFKVLPKTVDVDLDKLEEKIRKEIQPQKLTRQPIAFSLVAIQIVKLVPDSEGALEAVEKRLRAMEEVGEVEVTGITRSL